MNCDFSNKDDELCRKQSWELVLYGMQNLPVKGGSGFSDCRVCRERSQDYLVSDTVKGIS